MLDSPGSRGAINGLSRALAFADLMRRPALSAAWHCLPSSPHARLALQSQRPRKVWLRAFRALLARRRLKPSHAHTMYRAALVQLLQTGFPCTVPTILNTAHRLRVPNTGHGPTLRSAAAAMRAEFGAAKRVQGLSLMFESDERVQRRDRRRRARAEGRTEGEVAAEEEEIATIAPLLCPLCARCVVARRAVRARRRAHRSVLAPAETARACAPSSGSGGGAADRKPLSELVCHACAAVLDDALSEPVALPAWIEQAAEEQRARVAGEGTREEALRCVRGARGGSAGRR